MLFAGINPYTQPTIYQFIFSAELPARDSAEKNHSDKTILWETQGQFIRYQ